MTYYQMIRGVSKFDLRLQMVERPEQVGISQSAREYGTSRLTVRKWRGRSTPLEIFQEVPHEEISRGVFSLAPVIVDHLLLAWIEEKEFIQGGYHMG